MGEKGYSRDDWQKHYDENDLGWDLGQVAPPFVKLLESNIILPGKTLVPGCGRGHEVVYLAENGFNVTALDYSLGAVEYLRQAIQQRKLDCEILHVDFFDLNSSYDETYDLLIEQTFFCAISPNQRNLYVTTASRILRKGGVFAGLFYNTGQEGGPPFDTTQKEIIRHFSELFEIRKLSKVKNSANQRKDKEILGIFVKK